MPLSPIVLTELLLGLDEPSPPTTPEATAAAWFNAWWSYASQSVIWVPGFVELAKEAARIAFIPVLLPGCVPNPIPGIFYLALEGAMTAGWLAASIVPGALNPLLFVPPLVAPPLPGVLSAALVLTAPIGLASPTKHPVRIAMAAAIDTWTRTILITPIAGPPPVTLGSLGVP